MCHRAILLIERPDTALSDREESRPSPNLRCGNNAICSRIDFLHEAIRRVRDPDSTFTNAHGARRLTYPNARYDAQGCGRDPNHAAGETLSTVDDEPDSASPCADAALTTIQACRNRKVKMPDFVRSGIDSCEAWSFTSRRPEASEANVGGLAGKLTHSNSCPRFPRTRVHSADDFRGWVGEPDAPRARCEPISRNPDPGCSSLVDIGDWHLA